MTDTPAPTDNCVVGIDAERFPARDTGQRWNGWVCPTFSRETARLVVDYINHINRTGPAALDQDYLLWVTGDTLIRISGQWLTERDYQPDLCGPDEHGRYSIGAWSWTWSRTDEITVNPTHISAEYDPTELRATATSARQAWELTARAHGLTVQDCTRDLTRFGDNELAAAVEAVRIAGTWYFLHLEEGNQVRAHPTSTPTSGYVPFFDVAEPYIVRCQPFFPGDCDHGCSCAPSCPEGEYLLSTSTRREQIVTELARQGRTLEMCPPCNTVLLACTDQQRRAFWNQHPACVWDFDKDQDWAVAGPGDTAQPHTSVSTVITAEHLAAWVGRPLGEQEQARLIAAIPHSSIPDALSAILAGMQEHTEA